MNIKIRVVFWLLVFNAGMIQTKTDSTLIGRFEVEAGELAEKVTTFINNTKYDFVIRWTLLDPETLRQYSQEPILKRGESITIDYQKGLQYMQGAKKMEFSLHFLRVKKSPKGAGGPLVTTKLKDGSLALAIHKSKFLKNDTFALSLNKNGLLVCKSSSSSA
jgi:hypothetical protein